MAACSLRRASARSDFADLTGASPCPSARAPVTGDAALAGLARVAPTGAARRPLDASTADLPTGALVDGAFVTGAFASGAFVTGVFVTGVFGAGALGAGDECAVAPPTPADGAARPATDPAPDTGPRADPPAPAGGRTGC